MKNTLLFLTALALLAVAYGIDTLDRRVVELQSRITLLEDNINKGE